jgi:hypothetical protein
MQNTEADTFLQRRRKTEKNVKILNVNFLITLELELPSPQETSAQPAWQGEKNVVPEGG